jgi:hypothetical protein
MDDTVSPAEVKPEPAPRLTFSPADFSGGPIPKEILEGVSGGALRHTRILFPELFPKGRVAPEGGYWYVYELGIKLSFEKGGFFSLDAPESRRVYGNPITIWLLRYHAEFIDFDEEGNPYCTSAYHLRKAVADLANWIWEVENGPGPDPSYLADQAQAETEADLKAIIGHFLFAAETRTIREKSGRWIWEEVRKAILAEAQTQGEEIGDAENYFRTVPELASATRFGNLLAKWARKGETEFFSVREHPFSKRRVFTLTRSLREGETPEPPRGRGRPPRKLVGK